MKCNFIVERNFLVETSESIELDPKNFIHCSDIEELNNEIEDYFYENLEHPTHPNLETSKCLGQQYHNKYWDGSESFYKEWQKLKGLPQEL